MSSDGSDRRADERVPLQGEVTLECENFQAFLNDYAANISAEGMFVRTTEPPPVGSLVDFCVRLKDDFKLIHGTAEIVWVRPAGNAEGLTPGVGMKFKDLVDPSADLIRKIIDRNRSEGGEPFRLESGRFAMPTPDEVAPSLLQPQGGQPGRLDADSGSLDATELFVDAPPIDDPGVLDSSLLGGIGGLDGTLGAEPSADALSDTGTLSDTGPRMDDLIASAEQQRVELEATSSRLAAQAAAEASASQASTSQANASQASTSQGSTSQSSATPASREFLGIRFSPALFLLLMLAGIVGGATHFFLERMVNWVTGYQEQPSVNDIPTAEALNPVNVPTPTRRDAGGDAAGGAAIDPGSAESSPPASGAAVTRPDGGSAGTVATPASVQSGGSVAGPVPVAGSPLTKVRLITHKAADSGGTLVTLWGDGVVDLENISVTPLDGRVLVKILGVNWPFRDPMLQVGTTEVQRIRTGHHSKADGNELWIVFDLEGRGVEVQEIGPDPAKPNNVLLRLAR